MTLDTSLILKLDKARIEGASADEIHAALEQAGLDADTAFKEYASTPLKDGRLRKNVNLGDPAEWTNPSGPGDASPSRGHDHRRDPDGRRKLSAP